MARPRSDIRVRIQHAARKRFLAEGVDGASLRRIAKGARTSIGMVYYYFPTKDDLFLAVVEEIYSVVLADLLLALDPNQSVEDRIRGLYKRISAATDEELLVIRLVLREALVSSSRLDRIVERFWRGHLPLMFKLIGDGFERGTFDPKIHPAVVLMSMMALGGPGQLMRRVLEARAPFGVGVPAGVELSEQMLQNFMTGVGRKGDT
jgi:TetR/AcrR family transcriptional regulator